MCLMDVLGRMFTGSSQRPGIMRGLEVWVIESAISYDGPRVSSVGFVSKGGLLSHTTALSHGPLCHVLLLLLRRAPLLQEEQGSHKQNEGTRLEAQRRGARGIPKAPSLPASYKPAD